MIEKWPISITSALVCHGRRSQSQVTKQGAIGSLQQHPRRDYRCLWMSHLWDACPVAGEKEQPCFRLPLSLGNICSVHHAAALQKQLRPLHISQLLTFHFPLKLLRVPPTRNQNCLPFPKYRHFPIIIYQRPYQRKGVPSSAPLRFVSVCLGFLGRYFVLTEKPNRICFGSELR